MAHAPVCSAGMCPPLILLILSILWIMLLPESATIVERERHRTQARRP